MRSPHANVVTIRLRDHEGNLALSTTHGDIPAALHAVEQSRSCAPILTFLGRTSHFKLSVVLWSLPKVQRLSS
ncbi:hypothetical protein Plhal703r1_c02g0011611 [Plasmopara halstedii]